MTEWEEDAQKSFDRFFRALRLDLAKNISELGLQHDDLYSQYINEDILRSFYVSGYKNGGSDLAEALANKFVKVENECTEDVC